MLFHLKRLLAPAAIAGLLLAALVLGVINEPRANAPVSKRVTEDRAVRVTWVDGDSGRLDGLEFRLHGVDAPEGSSQRAKCARERELPSGARDVARSVTNQKLIHVSRRYGRDDYGRAIVDLVVEGRDVASQLVFTGKLKRWNFDGGEHKPSWCFNSPQLRVA
jgi:endonuclease YncB( thermonuclease family)